MREIRTKDSNGEWMAWVEDETEPVGVGKTREDAVEDLHAQLDGDDE